MSFSPSTFIAQDDVNKNMFSIKPNRQELKKARSLRIEKCVEQVLNPSVGSIMKEGPKIIDWDYAATLEMISEPITGRTGTPMFIATAVSVGSFPPVGKEAKYIRVDSFPKISEAAKAKYRKAYTKERYESYINALKNSDDIKRPRKTAPFEHLPLHDMESLFWLLAVLLCTASVLEPEEKSCSTTEYERFWQIMKAHNPGDAGGDLRELFLLKSSPEIWEKRLHSKLQSVSSMLDDMARYFSVNWVYWRGELNDDHAHEMMARVFLDHIVRIDHENADVIINLKKRRPMPTYSLLSHNEDILKLHSEED
ncbi:hypothetical protein EW145_g7771 [Phellinidium pouzarii]|uniref:Fungal-type protein kinase domain-containing protein n=1 Tax=Phellinidium pouzarii TaxID=167371 RepID=A0A4S4KET5_9AGAM|nr:hypothetical protein EW145_g7771 [Phellinidium pouzarii]